MKMSSPFECTVDTRVELLIDVNTQTDDPDVNIWNLESDNTHVSMWATPTNEYKYFNEVRHRRFVNCVGISEDVPFDDLWVHDLFDCIRSGEVHIIVGDKVYGNCITGDSVQVDISVLPVNRTDEITNLVLSGDFTKTNLTIG